MKYSFFPGCSLKSSATMYNNSIEALKGPLQIELTELPDWNCCGAAPYFSMDKQICMALSARNLALAEQLGSELVTSCNTCYSVLSRTNQRIRENEEKKDEINQILGKIGLHYEGTVVVKHFLGVLVNDIGLDRIESLVRYPLEDMRVACYYGCQGIRPREISFDHPESPVYMDYLMKKIGVSPVDFPLRTKCCGATLMATTKRTSPPLLRDILVSVRDSGADLIVTCCPMCQINLDIYQDLVNSVYKDNFRISVIYFTQLLGLAFGISPTVLMLDKGVVPMNKTLESAFKKVI